MAVTFVFSGDGSRPVLWRQMFRQGLTFSLGVVLRTRHQDDEVIGIAHGKEDGMSRFPIPLSCTIGCLHAVTSPACPEFRAVFDPSLIAFLDRTQGDIGKQACGI